MVKVIDGKEYHLVKSQLRGTCIGCAAEREPIGDLCQCCTYGETTDGIFKERKNVPR